MDEGNNKFLHKSGFKFKRTVGLMKSSPSAAVSSMLSNLPSTTSDTMLDHIVNQSTDSSLRNTNNNNTISKITKNAPIFNQNSSRNCSAKINNTHLLATGTLGVSESSQPKLNTDVVPRATQNVSSGQISKPQRMVQKTLSSLAYSLPLAKPKSKPTTAVRRSSSALLPKTLSDPDDSTNLSPAFASLSNKRKISSESNSSSEKNDSSFTQDLIDFSDDDDFEMNSSIISPPKSKKQNTSSCEGLFKNNQSTTAATPSSTPSTRKFTFKSTNKNSNNNAPSVQSSQVTTIPDSEDEDVIRTSKRPKKCIIVSEDDEDEEEEDDHHSENKSPIKNHKPVTTPHKKKIQPSSVTPPSSSPHMSSYPSKLIKELANIRQDPLLQKDSLTPEEVKKLGMFLFMTMDEICTIIEQISSADLMSLMSSNYERLQNLLFTRKILKNKTESQRQSSKKPNATDGKPSPVKNTPNLTSTVTKNTLKKKVSSKPTKVSTPLTNLNRSTTSIYGGIKSSPIPCGDSFFERDSPMTQSHLSVLNNMQKSSSYPAEALSFQNEENFTDGDEDLLASLDENQCMQFDYKVSESMSKTKTPTLNSSKKIISNNSNTFNKEISKIHHSTSNMNEFPDEEDWEPNDEDYSPSNTIQNSPTSAKESMKLSEILTQNPCPVEPVASQSVSNVQRSYVAIDGDSGITNEFDGFNFPHSDIMLTMFKQLFGLKKFRSCQLHAVNAALLGYDCFILMPTGGGKSLCYQLPSLVGKGVSIVISPLRALIQDQVERLTSLDIPAASLAGNVSEDGMHSAYMQLSMKEPGLKLVYTTPEKISASLKLMSVFENLNKRNLLDRFVIDEAHCVSQWGHDFRPDYKRLCLLREKFPNVPVMALTATATPRVRKDIIHQLRMKKPKWFVKSFNRPNLKFIVEEKKPKSAVDEIAKLIQTKYNNKSGIVYCLSRKECDEVAKNLCKKGIRALPYHAGLSDKQRTQAQEKWLQDQWKVICATIAFGMGIDKPDVRFVIHFSMPKSVEGYYQESGRAGRDGLLAFCILLYNYQDVKRLRRLIDLDTNASYEAKKVHIDNLFQMVRYCENKADCRRDQLLQYFGEKDFDREFCNEYPGAVCDNCSSSVSFHIRDVTEDVKHIIRFVREICHQKKYNCTLIHLVEVFRGSQSKAVTSLCHDRHSLHGRGNSYVLQDATRLLRKLVIDQILVEELVVTAMDHTVCYVKLGPRAKDVIENKIKVNLPVHSGKKATVTNTGTESVTDRKKLMDDCYQELVELAKQIAQERHITNYASVFPNPMLLSMAAEVPLTVEEMQDKIDGMTLHKIMKYGGERFLEITNKYCMMYANLDEPEPSTFSQETIDEWESPYFNSSTCKKRTGTPKKKGWRRKRNYRKKASSKGTTKRRSTAFKAAAATAKSSLNKFKYARTGTSCRSSASSKLGFMPAPTLKRSFLA